jgi:hypothetical protein
VEDKDKEVSVMKTSQRTSISDLDAIGRELTDEHLRLVAGGGSVRTSGGDRRTGCSNNVCWDTWYKTK